LRIVIVTFKGNFKKREDKVGKTKKSRSAKSVRPPGDFLWVDIFKRQGLLMSNKC